MAPPDADAERAARLFARLKTELDSPPYHAFLKPVAESVNPQTGEVRIRVTYRPEFSGSPAQPMYHGGIIAALIDLAGHAAVAVQTGRTAPTIDLRIDYLKMAGPSDLVIAAHVLRLGRSIARADIQVRDADDVLVAVGRGTFSTLQSIEAPSPPT